MRSIFITLSLLCTLVVSAQMDTIRVLAIGNSFSVNSVEKNLYELGREEGVVFVIGNLYIGSCSLKMHATNIRTAAPKYSYRKIQDGQRTVYDNTTLQTALSDEPWDYISMQQVSNTCGMISSYEPWLTELIDSVQHYAQPWTQLVWHMTWAYQGGATHPAFKDYGYSQERMYYSILDAVQQMLPTHDFAYLIPTGTTVQNLRQTALFGDHLSKDGYHMAAHGQYGCACTWFEVLTGISCWGNPYKPAWMTSKEQKILQLCAHEAVKTPFQITKINEDNAALGIAPDEYEEPFDSAVVI